MKIRKEWKILFIGFFTLFIPLTSLPASEYPTRPIEVVNPYTPGGGSDLVVRLFKDYVEKILGQPLVQIFKTGAGGAIGVLYGARSKPDGYTIVVGSNSALITPPLTKKGAGYTLDDFVPVCGLTGIPLVWCVKEDSPYKTLKDFVQVAKTKKMKVAGYGTFTAAHIAMEAVSKEAGFHVTNIPFSGAPEAMTAVLGGHADIAIAGSFAFVGPGKLRAIAIGGEKRLEAYPDIPTLKELGYRALGQIHYSYVAPKGTPKEITNKIWDAHKKALQENREEITKRAKAVDHTVLLLSPEELWQVYKADYEFQREIIKELGALVE